MQGECIFNYSGKRPLNEERRNRQGDPKMLVTMDKIEDDDKSDDGAEMEPS